jgi:predicted nucleic acid-binding protein
MPVSQTIKKLDQQRHELKALRYLLEFYPESVRKAEDLPSRNDFQIEDTRLIYDALMAATTKEEATKAIAALDLEETDTESFLRLGGQYYHTYPALVKEKGQEFRSGRLKIITPGE